MNPTICQLFMPLASEIRGESKRCRDCSRLESEHQTYQLVSHDEKKRLQSEEFPGREQFIAAMKARQLTQGEDCYRRGLRAELQGQPTFSSLLGPMYGGPGSIRYETQTANDQLSA